MVIETASSLAARMALQLVDHTSRELAQARRAERAANAALVAAIVEATHAGVSVRVIGAAAGITGTRVSQIYRQATKEAPQ